MNLLDRVYLDKVDVRHMTEDEMSRLGVRLVDHDQVVLQCLQCQETWEPLVDCAGKLDPDFWKCPAGCNG